MNFFLNKSITLLANATSKKFQEWRNMSTVIKEKEWSMSTNKEEKEWSMSTNKEEKEWGMSTVIIIRERVTYVNCYIRERVKYVNFYIRERVKYINCYIRERVKYVTCYKRESEVCQPKGIYRRNIGDYLRQPYLWVKYRWSSSATLPLVDYVWIYDHILL